MATEKWKKEHPEEMKKYRRDWYNKWKKPEYKRIKKRKRELRKWFIEYKKKLKCACGENDWRCLEFHHKKPKEKFKAVCMMVVLGYSKKRILEEIKKCKVLCANCHRKETTE